ncbi:hypothetical protein EPN18_05225, partial [bacterium]
MKTCFKCKKTLDLSQQPGRRDECPFCGADLKACFNCAFYSSSSSNKCREPRAELVTDKDRTNYCEYFEFADRENDRP